MKKEEIEKILWWERVEKDYFHYYSLFRNTDKMLSEFRYKCLHEIIVIPVPISYCSNRKCLLCGKEDVYLGAVGDNTILIYNYKSKYIYGLSSESRFEIVKKLFIKIASENPDMELSQVAKAVQEEIDYETSEFIELAKEEFRKM